MPLSGCCAADVFEEERLMEIESYGTAISSVKPGTFVPDIAPKAPAAVPLDADQNPDATAGASFRDTVKNLLGDVNDKMNTASQNSVALATGQSSDFDGTIRSVEEASLAFQFTESVRSKIMEAYSELQQMQF
jgi:flagellar hook-basal body complex protein FliE